MDKEKLSKLRFIAKRNTAFKYVRDKDYERGLFILKEILQEKEDEDCIKVFVNASLTYATQFTKDKNWLKVLDIYKDIIGFKESPKKVYKNIGLCMCALGYDKDALEYFKVYKDLAPDDKEVYSFIGEIAMEKTIDYPLAIECYEKLLKMGEETYIVYNTLGHLYSKFYRDSHKEEQIHYFEEALELEPENRLIVNNLAFVYGKFGEIQKADKMYGKLLMMNPKHSELHSYGAYLVKHKRFKAGFRFLRHRFQKEDIPGAAFGNIIKHLDKLWKIEEPLDNKRVLVHYEQGFGDSIMFVRFLKELKNYNVELVLQGSLIDLFKDSGIEVPIKNLEEVNIEDYDCIIPMMDLPLVCNLKADNIPYAEGYLKVPESKVKEYGEKYIKKSSKLKVGFAFEGSEASLVTKRDIPVELFYKIMKMKNVDVYCLQVGDIYKQLDRVPRNCKFTRLGGTFNNWEDTACAIENMDLIITSDNGVMNLAGALGAKTFGVFNSMTEWRWIKTQGDDIAWYKSIRPFQCPSTDDWASAMKEVTEEVRKLANPV